MQKIPKSDRALVSAILGAFRDPATLTLDVFARFSSGNWRRTETWLDSSGLALYWLDLLRKHSTEYIIASETLARLTQKLDDNTARTLAMADEFCSLNQQFLAAGLSYVNLKGFTLVPLSCSNSNLRHQSDLDFLMSEQDIPAALRILQANGYQLKGRTAQSLELCDNGAPTNTIGAQYEANLQRSVELHLPKNDTVSSVFCYDQFKLQQFMQTAGGKMDQFPCLDGPDQLIQQALHILQHLRNECTKASWLLEFRNHLEAKGNEPDFSRKVWRRAANKPLVAMALRLAEHLACGLFGSLQTNLFHSAVIKPLPPRVKAWADTFGAEAILADAPGTKLYLFLEAALRHTEFCKTEKTLLQRFIPIHRPKSIIEKSSLKQYPPLFKLQILWFRCKFHLTRNAQVMCVAPLWWLTMHRLKQAGFDSKLIAQTRPANSLYEVTQDNNTKTFV